MVITLVAQAPPPPPPEPGLVATACCTAPPSFCTRRVACRGQDRSGGVARGETIGDAVKSILDDMEVGNPAKTNHMVSIFFRVHYWDSNGMYERWMLLKGKAAGLLNQEHPG